MSMEVLKFEPLLKPTIWGGSKLVTFKHLQTDLDNVGESLEVSGVPGNESVVSEGEFKGRKLNELLAEMKEKLVGEDNYRRFGDRFPLMYFVAEYGLDYYAAFPGCSAETEPSVGTMTFLIDKMKENRIPVVFKTELSNDNIARTISEETGAKVRTFYACHNVSAEDYERGFSYLDMMKENVEVLKEALN